MVINKCKLVSWRLLQTSFLNLAYSGLIHTAEFYFALVKVVLLSGTLLNLGLLLDSFVNADTSHWDNVPYEFKLVMFKIWVLALVLSDDLWYWNHQYGRIILTI